MEVIFFTEGGYHGKVLRDNVNMRTDLAWVCALNADHCNIHSIPTREYDLGIVIIPKKNPNVNISKFRQYCKQVAVMQEGPNWYWQDYALSDQINYFNALQEADFIFVHNHVDKKYYEGLTDKTCKILPTLMIEDSIRNLPIITRQNVIIGGNFCSWYSGFDSYIVAQEAECPIYIPSMGRKIQDEELVPNLNHLPYMNWVEWIHTLNQFKYGVHLMRTHAAGTFALNCAYLGIPCIGYEGLDTQYYCHPELTVKLGDLTTAKKLMNMLSTDDAFYDMCSKQAKANYSKHYKEEIFLNDWK